MAQKIETELPSASEGQAERGALDNLGFWGRLIGIVDQPARVLASTYAQPRGAWFGPILMLMVSVIVLNIVSAPYAAQEAKEEIRRQLQVLPEAQASQMAAQMESLTSPVFIGATGAVTGILGVVVSILIASGILYFSSLVVGAEVDFAPLFGVVAWLWMPFFLRDLVETGYIFYSGGLIINQGLSWLVSVGDQMKDAGNIAYFLLSYVQVFVLWHLLLLWIGLRGALRLSAGASLLIVVIYAVASLIVRWIPLTISRQLAGTVGN